MGACSWGWWWPGVLFYRWQPLPFILCGFLIMVFTYLTVAKIQEPEPERSLLPPSGRGS